MAQFNYGLVITLIWLFCIILFSIAVKLFLHDLVMFLPRINKVSINNTYEYWHPWPHCLNYTSSWSFPHLFTWLSCVGAQRIMILSTLLVQPAYFLPSVPRTDGMLSDVLIRILRITASDEDIFSLNGNNC